VSWLQEKAGDDSLAPTDGERVRSPQELWNNLYYDSEIAIVTPATRVLGWLAESLGGEYEFGDEVD
jgi:hypothetical protein